MRVELVTECPHNISLPHYWGITQNDGGTYCNGLSRSTVPGFSPEAVQAAADVLAIDSLASWDEIAEAALAAAWATDFGGDT